MYILPDSIYPALTRLYGETVKSRERYKVLASVFSEYFPTGEPEYFSAPGRTEIIGNHTDHNGGLVMAAAIDMDSIAAARPNGTQTVHLISEHYAAITMDLQSLASIPAGPGTLPLLAGLLNGAQENGFAIGGFDVCVVSDVIPAAGVSSSASFEMLICAVLNRFFNGGRMTRTDYVRIGAAAESSGWNKACGMMDQTACAFGGMVLLDFHDSRQPKVSNLDFDFDRHGYELILVNTGKSHADLSVEYSEIPMDMQAAAQLLGCERLCGTSLSALLTALPGLRQSSSLNDRALLRALHFFTENDRVKIAASAAREGNVSLLLEEIRHSGDSSFKLLQNCSCRHTSEEQSIPVALAMTQLFAEQNGCLTQSAFRVHGGGFAGVISCILPEKYAGKYLHFMGSIYEPDHLFPVRIRPQGAVCLSTDCQ